MRDCCLKYFGAQPTRAVYRQPLGFRILVLTEPEHRVEHCVMFDRGGENTPPAAVFGPPGPVQTLDRQVVRLGAAAGEHDLARPRAIGPRDALARLFHDPAGRPASLMQRRWVSGPPQLSDHRLDGLGEHRGCRSMVKVDGGALRHSGPSVILRTQPLRFSISSTSWGTTLNRSPTTPKSASSKIGASRSLFTTMIVLDVCIPARCWIAPEIPTAT